MCDGTAAVKTALGMGDNIYLFTASFLADLLDPFCKLTATFLHRSGRLLVAEINTGTVPDQFRSDPAPVVQIPEIPEENTVYHKNGIFGFTDSAFFSGLVQFPFFCLLLSFQRSNVYHFRQVVNVQTRDPGTDHRQNPPFDAKLGRGNKNADHAIPEEDCFCQNDMDQTDDSQYGSGFDISGRLVCPVQPGENTQGKNKGCTQGSQKQDKLVAAAVQKINGLRWGLLCFDPDISQQKDCKQQVKKKTEIKEDHAGYGTGTPDMIKNLQIKGDEVDVQDDQKI